MLKRAPGLSKLSRSEAGKQNRAKRRGLSDSGRLRLREAILRNKPWEKSTGPKTPEGKARSSQNAKKLWWSGMSFLEMAQYAATFREAVDDMQRRNADLEAFARRIYGVDLGLGD